MESPPIDTPLLDDELQLLLVHVMMRPQRADGKPPWELAPRLPQLLAGAVLAEYRGLKMSDLRYASPVFLDVMASLILAIGEWRADGSRQGIEDFKGELHIATDRFDLFAELITRDHILPLPERHQVCQALGSIEETWLREALIESTRENHPYLSLATLLTRGSPETLTFLGKLYRGIAHFYINNTPIKWLALLGELHDDDQ